MGTDPPSVEGPWGVPPLVVTADCGHGDQTSMGWDMGVPTHWGVSDNGGAG